VNEFERAWVGYGTKCVPLGACAEQAIQTKQAFYVGALVVLNVLKKIINAQANQTQNATDECRLKNMDQHINETCRGFVGG